MKNKLQHIVTFYNCCIIFNLKAIVNRLIRKINLSAAGSLLRLMNITNTVNILRVLSKILYGEMNIEQT